MICKQCGKEYEKQYRCQNKYCSKECRLIANKPKPNYTKLPSFEVKIKSDSKYCKHCNKDKPLHEFRLRKKPNGMRSYGRCKECEGQYEYLRRRAKGIPIRKPSEKKLIIKRVIHDVKAVLRMKAIKRHRLAHPHITHTCKECGVLFEGPKSRVFCNTKCYNRNHRRIEHRKKRARLRMLKVDNVDPINVFTLYHWHCANCGDYTPRHLKGKHMDNSPELDHIIPLSKGGEHSYTNTQLLCRKCNGIKSNNLTAKLTG